MRKDRKPRNQPLAEIPQHILTRLEDNPDLAGMGNSTDPRDNVWSGYQGDFDVNAALAVDGDPEGALGRIVIAIVNSNAGAEPEYKREKRISGVIAKLLNRKARPGPKPGDSDQGKKRVVLPIAAYLVYARRLNPTLGASDWRTCIWDALTSRQREQRYPDGPQGEKFNNFYNDCMKFMRDNGNEDTLVLEASVRDEGVGEVNLEQARWRQEIIDRVISDLAALGIVKR